MTRKPASAQAQSKILASLIGRITSPAMKRRGFRDVQIMDHWPAIVGAHLAQLTLPERLVRRGPNEMVLLIRVDGAMALEIQHLAPQIIERVNQYYGHGTITRLQIIQGPVPHSGPHCKVDEQAIRRFKEQAEEELMDFPAGQLRGALARLGARIMLRESQD